MIGLKKGCLWRIEKKENFIATNVNAENVPLPAENEANFCHGDIIEVLSDDRIIKLHSGDSPNALIFVTNQCNSNCIMCPDSVKQRTRPNKITIEYLQEYIALLPTDLIHVDITGGEPTLLKENLPNIIESVKMHCENAEILMLSNGRSFASDYYTKLFGTLATRKFKIEIPVHGANTQLHDRIAGCKGSFEQTRRGIHNLLKQKIQVGIRIVVSKLNYQVLNEIIEFIHNEYPEITYVNIMGMEVMGNAWKNRELVWKEMEELRKPLQGAVEKCFECGIDPRLYNFPLCLFEKKYWYCYRKSISDYKIRYFNQCEECKEKQKCGGFFNSTFHHTKYEVQVQR